MTCEVMDAISSAPRAAGFKRGREQGGALFVKIALRPRAVFSSMSSPSGTFAPAGALAARERHALWAALVLILVWGTNFSVQKQVFNALSPGGFLFVRYLIMPVAAALLLCSQHGRHWPHLSRGEWLALLKLGITGHLLHVGLVTYGIHWSTPFSSSLILACGPVFTLLILRWHGIERLTRGQVIGVGVASAGVLVFLSDKLLGAAVACLGR